MRVARQLLAVAGVLGVVMSYVTVRITATNRCAVAGVACGHEPHHPYLGAAIALLVISILVLAGAALVGKRT